jgi:hypothetical protein
MINVTFTKKYNKNFDLDEESRKKILEKIRLELINLNKLNPSCIVEAIGEYNQGNSAESYYLIRNYLIRSIPDIDVVPKSIIIGEVFKYHELESN